jgi:carbon-monoxide dehydrogenase large subunit
MLKFGEHQSVKRREDVRFLTGEGQYVDDTAPDGALHAFMFRSSVAHAEIDGIGTDDAAAVDGVHMVITAETLLADGRDLDFAGGPIKNRDGSTGAKPPRPQLAVGRVRFVGEPIAMIIAETMEAAKEAAELIEFDYTDLPVHVDVVVGGEELHSQAPGNLAFNWAMGDEDATNAALNASAHRISLEIEDNRVIANSMEPRGCWADWDGSRLHMNIGGQGVWGAKGAMAGFLGLEADDVHVITTDVGGGFGMKAFNYPEYFVVAWASQKLGKPIRWASERTEAMLTDNGGRDLVSQVEIGFDENMKITAYKLDSVCNMGAYNSGFAQFIQTDLFSKVFSGTYDIKTGFLGVKGIYTNTTQVDAYRGAGRPEAIYVLERTMDFAARELGVDPFELRRRNFIAPADFPYKTVTDVTYDCGEFNRVLNRAIAEADVAGFEARKAASAANGKLRGMGLCYYIESILGNPTETAAVEFRDDGTAAILVGTQSNGQGHETVYAQFLADQTGMPFDKIDVVQGDSDLIPSGGGTGGSRSVTVQNNATLATVDVMVASFIPFIADQLDVAADEVSFDDGRFRADGSNQTPDLLEAAAMARIEGREDLLKHTATATLDARSFPNGAHIAEMEIDPQTGVVECVKYTVTDDFGNLVHPMLVEGQIHGGIAQGLGQAVTERVVYDEDGQLLTASFMDYAMPRADNMPMVKFTNEVIPTTTNPMGMKGCGEAGTVGALAAVTNGVLDAVWEHGIHRVDMPMTPNRVWQMLSHHAVAAE